MLLSHGGVNPVNVFANQFPSIKMMWLVSTVLILSVMSSYRFLSNVPPGKFQLGSLIKSYPAMVVSVANFSASFFQSATVLVLLCTLSQSEGFVGS